MIAVAEALQRILARIPPARPERLALAQAQGRYLLGEEPARLSLPPFDNSAMDGFAIRFGPEGQAWRLRGEQPAGRSLDLRLGPGECIRIFTGAPLPEGADAVLMQEDAEVRDGTVTALAPVEAGENIRRAGSDICAGQTLTAAGDRITPALAGLLASQGIAEITVGAVPSVTLLATGDELMSPGEPLRPGCIYESNLATLAPLIASRGGTRIRTARVPDDPAQLHDAIRAGLADDLLIICGGMSVGAHDHVKRVLTEHGVETDFWRVSMKPGKPFLFGRGDDCLVFGLPGNPVSAFVTCLLFVLPALARRMGGRDVAPKVVRLPAAGPMANPGERETYFRGVLRAEGFLPLPGQSSHQLAALARADALARVAPGSEVSAGDPVDVLPV